MFHAKKTCTSVPSIASIFIKISEQAADTRYGSRDNRNYLERNHIRFAGKLQGRPPKITPENKDELMRLKAQR